MKRLSTSPKQWIWMLIIVTVIPSGLIALNYFAPDITGFGSDQTVNEELDKNNNVIKRVRVEQPGKTLWDWMSAFLIPGSLAGLGFWFQHLQQQQTKAQADLEREIAETNRKEEALQAYLDRMSELLLDKDLKNLEDGNVALEVASTRTLTVLRRIGGTRKGIVIQFLYDAGLIGGTSSKPAKASIDLCGADVSRAVLHDAYLEKAWLRRVNFNQANLERADLSHAYLVRADLRNTDLRRANLTGANLTGAKLDGAKLDGVDLSHANLSNACLENVVLSDHQLEKACLCDTKMPCGSKLDPNRDCQALSTTPPILN